MSDDTERRDAWREAQTPMMAQTDDTAARSDAYHEANDRAEQVTEVGAERRNDRTSRGEDPDTEARRIEHERKNTNADGSLVPVEDRRPREDHPTPSEVTHPSNGMPGHPALTNVGTIHDR